jgi:hypothetical protein
MEKFINFIYSFMKIVIGWSIVRIIIHIIDTKYPGLYFFETYPLYLLVGIIVAKTDRRPK